MERNGAGFRKTPTPIFSKKPRQALLAHPNNMNSTNDVSGTYSGNRYRQAEVSGRSYSKRSFDYTNEGVVRETEKDHTSSHPYSSYGGNDIKPFCDSNLAPVYQKPVTPHERNSHVFQPHSSARHETQIKKDTHTNMQPNPLKPSFHGPSQPMSTFQPSQSGSNQMQHTSYGQYNTRGPSYVGLGGQSITPSPVKGMQPYGQACLPNYTQNPVTGLSEQSGKSKSSYPSVTEKVKKTVTASKVELKTEKKELDGSLRFITTSVQGMKHWAQYTNRVTLIFEVFGYLDSAVSAEDRSSARMFRLRDDKDLMDCVFYQIDRSLPNMVRGRWYRCVGKWNHRKDSMQCMSVREASSDERSVYKLKINSSDRAMREWKFKHSEL